MMLSQKELSIIRIALNFQLRALEKQIDFINGRGDVDDILPHLNNHINEIKAVLYRIEN